MITQLPGCHYLSHINGKDMESIKVGDTFWELNNGVIYPRIAHSQGHCEYYLKRLNKVTFPTKEDAEKALKER